MKQKILYIATIVSMLTACNDNAEQSIVEAIENPVFFSADIHSKNTGRMVDNQWEQQDAIGVFMLEPNSNKVIRQTQNKRYVLDGKDLLFKPASREDQIFYPNKDNVVFVAYYPQQDMKEVPYYSIDLSNQEKESEIDLLYTDEPKIGNATMPKVGLQMNHRLSRIEVNLKAGENLSPALLEKARVRLSKQNTTAKFDILRNEPVTYFMTTAGNEEISFKKDGTSYSAIILPQCGFGGRQVNITLTDGTTFTHDIESDRVFGKGQKVVFNMTLHRAQKGTGKIKKLNISRCPWDYMPQ